MVLLSPPEPLGSHQISGFTSGTPSIDSWLRSHAHTNEAKGASRTYVISDPTDHVIAFYSIAANAVETTRLPSRMSRNMPNPIPVLLLGQLAVDINLQARGLGSALLADALKRCLAASLVIGARAVIVNAVDRKAAAFYARFGFRQFSDTEQTMLFLPISRIPRHP